MTWSKNMQFWEEYEKQATCKKFYKIDKTHTTAPPSGVFVRVQFIRKYCSQTLTIHLSARKLCRRLMLAAVAAVVVDIEVVDRWQVVEWVVHQANGKSWYLFHMRKRRRGLSSLHKYHLNERQWYIVHAHLMCHHHHYPVYSKIHEFGHIHLYKCIDFCGNTKSYEHICVIKMSAKLITFQKLYSWNFHFPHLQINYLSAANWRGLWLKGNIECAWNAKLL